MLHAIIKAMCLRKILVGLQRPSPEKNSGWVRSHSPEKNSGRVSLPLTTPDRHPRMASSALSTPGKILVGGSTSLLPLFDTQIGISDDQNLTYLATLCRRHKGKLTFLMKHVVKHK